LKPGRTAIFPWLAQCVLAARAHGLAVLDGTYNDLNNWQGFHAECDQARDLGMDGKTLIHPRQVPIANDVFAPTEEEVEWAEKVLTAFARPENAGKGVISVEGQMVERMHELMAARVIETATAILPE
ncbi:MAG: HpcH/HpaI aldolase/citrate lyase family protein, partial [Bauldia sp.]|nr:HpcH/HpaI aldolase/citrate lyase family protein [Bauldia sp.]